MADGLGSSAIDSHEVRRKQGFVPIPKSDLQSLPTAQSGVPSTIAIPRAHSDLFPEVQDTLQEVASLQYTPNTNYIRSNVYPQRLPGKPNHTKLYLPVRGSQNPNQSEFATPQSSTIEQNPKFPSSPTSSSGPLRPTINSPSPTLKPELSPYPRNHNSGHPGASPSRKLEQVFQEAGDRLESVDRLSYLVSSIEKEMQKSGVNVSFSKFKDHLIQLQDEGTEVSTSVELDGEFVRVEDGSVPTQPAKPKLFHPPQEAKARNWSSLFKAQAPSKSARLDHYPEFQKGKDAHVTIDESQIEDGVGNHCLVGNFLDGKMAMPLLYATARAVWKVQGKFSIKQLGSCYLFEFEDEATKLKVLEGGPYFFSRRYLVLEEWKRMLVPSKNHPSSIPVWIKLHRLPLEFWNHVAFSKIASAVGKPIYVDEATAQKKRLDYARICVEIEAGEELPSDISISVNAESVMVGVEYQWLPPKCEKCKVFGHVCSTKPAPTEVPNEATEGNVWRVVGKGKATSASQVPLPSSITKPGDLVTEQSDPQPSPSAAQAVDKPGVHSPAKGSSISTVGKLSSQALSPPTNPQISQTQQADDTSSEEMDEDFLVADSVVCKPYSPVKPEGDATNESTNTSLLGIADSEVGKPIPQVKPGSSGSSCEQLGNYSEIGEDFKLVSNKKKKKGRSNQKPLPHSKGR